MPVEPFTIDVPEATLADLRGRLDATRWPDELDGAGWETGTALAYMKSLAAYWRSGYDWRQHEAALNRLPQYRATVDGQRIHFIHVRGTGRKPLPLIVTHGWPGSFAEMVRLIPLLADPAASGGAADDAFDVVVPSLPGYGFSDAPRERGTNARRIAAQWARLMTELGYERFGAQGGDWGAAVSLMLGLEHRERLAGAHVNYLAGRFLLGGSLNQPQADPIAGEYRDRLRAWWDKEGGYSHEQGTKPQTLGYALNDSPVGLAAWIVEKFRTWSDCGGDVERAFGRDTLLTNIMIYWVSRSITSSMRLYAEDRGSPIDLSGKNRVEVPVGVAVFPKEIPQPPRALAERGLNVARWTEMSRGGHFAALEQPELLADDIRAFFRPLR